MSETYAGYSISYRILGGDLLPEAGDDQGQYDETESVRKYARMVRERLGTEFPGAQIEIDLQERTSGAGGGVVVITPDGGDYRPGDYGEGGRIADHVEEICGEVWESWKWVVYEEDDE